MGQKVVNSFIKGINKDLSISKNSNQSITYGLDINIVTNEGESTGSITNHKGNELSFTIPNTSPIYAIELNGSTGSSQVEINSIASAVITVTSQTTILDIYNELISFYSAQIASGEYGIFYNNQQVVVVGFTLDPTVQAGLFVGGFSYSTITPAQENLSIIGWTTLEDDIILFTTNRENVNADPIGNSLSYYGQIWRIQYDKATDTIISPSGGNLNAEDHLVYNNLLQFSLFNEIEREAIGIIESTIKGTIYWTDDYNNPRALNIFNSQCIAIPVNLLDWKPGIELSTPIITSLLESGNNPVGSYQIAYKLYTVDGATSIYSPTSTVINLTDSKSSENYVNFIGSPTDVNSGKSIRFKIENIDRTYDFIKLVAVRYELKDQPVIFSFADLPITDEVMEIVFTGNEVQIPITIAEFTSPNISFDTCKTFTQKKNRLYPANTTSTKFVVDWDSRAYRFSSALIPPFPVADLYSRNNTALVPNYTISSVTLNWPTDENIDAVNAYNDESGQIFGLDPTGDYTADWLANYQFKYQSDGSTIGGEGPNLSYEFVIKDYIGDNTGDSIPLVCPFVNVTSTVTGDTVLYNPTISNIEHPLDGLDSIKSPLTSTIFVGYSRGEVYRFGIVFLNDKGEESFAKWIGDIRIPEPWEDSVFELSSLSGSDLSLKSIGIKFTVDTSSLPTDITGFRFVRLERTEGNRNRLGTGVTIGVRDTAIQLATSPALNATNILALGERQNVDYTRPLTDTLSIYNDFRSTSSPYTYGNLGIIKFPNFDFDKYTLNDASHIKLMSAYTKANTDYNGTGDTYWAWNFIDPGPPGTYRYMIGVAHKANAVASNSSSIVTIDNQTPVGIDGVISSSFSTNMGGLDFHNIVPYHPTTNDPAWTTATNGVLEYELSGLGAKSLFVDYGTEMSTLAFDPSQYQIISLCRFNQGQYGGPWNSSRYNNIYISCSDFIPKDLYNSTSQDIDVFNGDTYVNFYNTPYFFMHWGEAYDIDEASPSGLGSLYFPFAQAQCALAICFPAECYFNPDMRHGKFWNKDQVNQFFDTFPDGMNDAGVFARFLSDDFLYNDSFSQENNLKTYSSIPFNFTELTNQPNYVWASRRKITGENIDNWRLYPSNDFIPLELVQGEINRIVNLKENLIAYQDKGICGISSEERSAIPDTTGLVLQVGTGSILNRYDYISKDTGSLHQHSVVSAPNSVFHYDARLNKFFTVKSGEGIVSLSDVKGLFNFFKETVIGSVKASDNILLGDGIEGVYDNKYNKAYYTFLNKFRFEYSSITIVGGNNFIINDYEPKFLHNILAIGNTYDLGTLIIKVTYIDNSNLHIEVVGGSIDDIIDSRELDIRFTIAYNDNIQAFESFYSFTPTLYICTGERLVSANPRDTNNSAYEHYIGDYGVFYDQDPSTSHVEIIVNLPDGSKIPTFRLDNLEIWTECFDENGLDVPLETITGSLIYTDYQTTSTSLLDLIAQTNIIRKERTWRVNQVYDYTDPTQRVLPYLRNKYAKIRLMYNNQNNNNLKLHEVTSNITLSYY